ncbi:MAG: 50S ribosomal protein L9 [Deltaproteobacteria bacterium]|mgnify:CR=1 FL=1|jgi:large subunit ribosomal protein L9|nr:50S ribosomal protein L9 [Deltaproteobacteria bacterium]MBT4525122.1 50S ribosomal protein L9 [Deltaproteobacteria bacterium]
MKIILTRDVEKLGSLGDELEVKPGYARNFLIPQGKAVPVTRDNIKTITHKRALLDKQRADAISKSKELAKKIESAEVEFKMKSGDSGKLFGSVTLKHIYEALDEKGIELDRKKLTLASPIKNLGKHEILVKLHTEVNATLVVVVTPESIEVTPSENEGEAVEGEVANAEESTEVSEETESKAE